LIKLKLPKPVSEYYFKYIMLLGFEIVENNLFIPEYITDDLDFRESCSIMAYIILNDIK